MLADDRAHHRSSICAKSAWAYSEELVAAIKPLVPLGLGTVMVYPSLIAADSDASEPTWRARFHSVYRFWRDLGYAIGALAAGVIADRYGYAAAIYAIAGLTFLSGLIVAVAMREQSHALEDVDLGQRIRGRWSG
jgi:predicted MFS family arabinose efflux permease